MANPVDPLAELADILEPELQLGWQLAPGWWLLIIIITALIAGIAYTFYKKWRFLAAKRQAQLLLQQVDLQHQQAALQINQLIKRVLQHYAPAHPALTASTEQWQRFLQQLQPDIPLPSLTSLLYQATAGTEATQQFYSFTTIWLQKYRGDVPLFIKAEAINA